MKKVLIQLCTTGNFCGSSGAKVSKVITADNAVITVDNTNITVDQIKM